MQPKSSRRWKCWEKMVEVTIQEEHSEQELSTREHSGLVVAEEQVNKRVHLNGIRMQ
jgi:hypothetical protein